MNKLEYKKAIEVKWVYKTKLNLDSFVNKFKAMYVVNVYTQMFEVDFSKTFASIAKLDTVRMLLAIAAQKN